MRKILSLVTLFAMTHFAGCAHESSPNTLTRMGESSRVLRAQQVIDPSAPTRNAGTSATDGKLAAGAQKNYAESNGYTVKEAKPQAVIEIPTQGRR